MGYFNNSIIENLKLRLFEPFLQQSIQKWPKNIKKSKLNDNVNPGVYYYSRHKNCFQPDIIIIFPDYNIVYEQMIKKSYCMHQ